MRIGSLRLATLCAVALALAAPVAALSARGPQTERGVVQSVNASQIVLRALDGSTVSVRLLPSTRVRLNGAKASVSDISPGAVAEVTTDRKGRAVLIRAFASQPSTPATVTESGVVTQVTKSSLSYTTADGSAHTVTLDGNTRVRQGGGSSKRNALRPGAAVQVTRTGDTATVVDVLSRGA